MAIGGLLVSLAVPGRPDPLKLRPRASARTLVRMDLDHAAIALRDVSEALRTLVGDLGGRVLMGGQNIGFRAMQLRLGEDGMRVELIEPWATEQSDFLVRFLDDRGEGPHHLTFKTEDIVRDLERAEAAGYEPVGVRLDNPSWREAFLHPRQAMGTVVQLAESDMDPVVLEESPELFEEASRSSGEFGPKRWWPGPGPRGAEEATFRRVCVAVGSVGDGLALYRDLLRGEEVDRGEGWIELGWPRGGRVRLEERGDAEPGIHRFECTGQPHGERSIGRTRFRFVRR